VSKMAKEIGTTGASGNWNVSITCAMLVVQEVINNNERISGFIDQIDVIQYWGEVERCLLDMME